MSVEAINGSDPQDRLVTPEAPASLVRVQVVFHAWRTGDRPTRGRRSHRLAASELRKSSPQGTGSPMAAEDAPQDRLELAGPAMIAMVIGVAAAVDTTGIVLILTLSGVALLALTATCTALVRRGRLRSGRRIHGRHRARGQNGYVVIVGRWCVSEGRP
jgi:hypothetical protein